MADENTAATVEEDTKTLNKRGLAKFWELIQAYYAPISTAELDELTGITLVDANSTEN